MSATMAMASADLPSYEEAMAQDEMFCVDRKPHTEETAAKDSAAPMFVIDRKPAGPTQTVADGCGPGVSNLDKRMGKGVKRADEGVASGDPRASNKRHRRCGNADVRAADILIQHSRA